MELQSFVSRMIIFPFQNVVKRNDWDNNLSFKLKKDVKGIIEFGIKGLKRLREDQYQIKETPEMQGCKNDYAGQYDSFSSFADEYIKLDVMESLSSTDIKLAYQKYCQQNEFQILSDNQWSQILKRRFGGSSIIISSKDESQKRKRGYKGITFRKKIKELLEEKNPHDSKSINNIVLGKDPNNEK